jgi:AhpD family alkylhydroperoxidase
MPENDDGIFFNPIRQTRKTEMTRLQSKPADQATGETAQLFAVIRKAAGKVPNAYADIGMNSPASLESLLHIDAALAKSSLSRKEVEAIKLAVSEASGCDYCLAAHSMIGKKVGLDDEALRAARHGSGSNDARIDALTSFIRLAVTTRDLLPAHAVEAVRSAGYSDTQITEALLAVTAVYFTNLFNRINDTELDFPALA